MALTKYLLPDLPPATLATFTGTIGNNTQNGTSSADTFNYAQGGNDTLNGLGGGDTFNLGATFTALDKINGGNGNDTLNLAGNYNVTLGATTLVNVETIHLANGFDYALFFNDANVGNNQTLVIDGSSLNASSNLTSLSGAEMNGHVDVTGGAGDDDLFGGQTSDVLTGGGGADHLAGAKGADTLEGGAGADQYDLARPGGPAGVHDTFIGFDAAEDEVAIIGTISAVEANVTNGTLNQATFEADLAAAIGASELGKKHAVLFQPDAGDLAGHIFLIIDQNSNTGYQQGKDHVVELVNPNHLGQLDPTDFVPSH